MASLSDHPLVSVIVTSFNQRHFLEKTINSVLNQTYENIEIVIADDCSSDDTDEYINHLKKKSKFPVNYIRQTKNVGIPRNRNTALKEIKGQYFLILDGDDMYYPSNIEKMINKMNDGFDAVYTNIVFIDENDNYIRTRDKSIRPEGYIAYEIGLGIFGIMRNMMFAADIIPKTGLMDERLPKYDGYDFTFRVSMSCKIGYINEVLAYYRVHVNSDSRQLKPIDHYKDSLQIRKNIRECLRSQELLERTQARDIITYWNIRLFEYWLKLPMLSRIKFSSFSISVILASFFGPLSLLEMPPPGLKRVFLTEKKQKKNRHF